MSDDGAVGPDDDDPMGPPKEPCECWCMQCRRIFMSNEIWFQRIIGDPSGFTGRWMCPTPNCDGGGFTFDIFPTDPDHPDIAGWYDDHADDDDEEDDVFEEFESEDSESETEYDPAETKWRGTDERFGPDAEDDLEGEEWKLGLQPGERPPEPNWMEQARREDEEREKQFEEPDRRPREVEWRQSDDRSRPPIGDEDIPF